MLKKNIIYQKYSPGDEKGIVEVLRIVFPKFSKLENPLESWTWKHLEGPHPTDIYVAKDAEQIVGVMHRLVLDIKIGNSIMLSHYGDDMAVHPDYRELGIWKNLKNMADKNQNEKNIKFYYLSTENPIVMENIIKMGLNPTKLSLSHFFKIRDQESFLKRSKRDSLVNRVGVAALTGFGEVKHLISSSPRRNDEFSIVDIPKFDHSIDVFWENVKESYDYCIVKKANYLNWRHSRLNISERRIRVAVRDGEVLGFSVLSLREDGDYQDGSISELLTLPNRLDVTDALMGDAIEYFNHLGVAAIDFKITKGHPYGGLAERNGFIDASSQYKNFFYYTISKNSIPVDYLETLHPSRVYLNYF